MRKKSTNLHSTRITQHLPRLQIPLLRLQKENIIYRDENPLASILLLISRIYRRDPLHQLRDGVKRLLLLPTVVFRRAVHNDPIQISLDPNLLTFALDFRTMTMMS
jgi:hypothetical protein